MTSSYQKELEKAFSGLNQPFASSSFPKKIPRKDIREYLDIQIKKKILQKKKIGSMYVYWRTGTISSNETVKKAGMINKKELSLLQRRLDGAKTENKELSDQIGELEGRLEEEKERNARLRKIDAIDEIGSEWEEIAYRMGESLAFVKGTTLKDVLKQFGAPTDD
ncbi:MAG: hypothetical protein ACXAEU_18485 [Candidatus Hodarchaeales archaeon]|jgi:predicted  nucleic acid-binding Zn-ribbon protein